MVEKNRLRQWLDDNPSVSCVRLAEKVGVTGSYVTQMARDVGAPWPGREVARLIALATGGQVTPNDLAGVVIETGKPVRLVPNPTDEDIAAASAAAKAKAQAKAMRPKPEPKPKRQPKPKKPTIHGIMLTPEQVAAGD